MSSATVQDKKLDTVTVVAEIPDPTSETGRVSTVTVVNMYLTHEKEEVVAQRMKMVDVITSALADAGYKYRVKLTHKIESVIESE